MLSICENYKKSLPNEDFCENRIKKQSKQNTITCNGSYKKHGVFKYKERVHFKYISYFYN